MTAGRIALLWIVLVAAWPVLNLNDPLRQVSRYVSVLLQRATWELPETVPDGNLIQMGQTKDVLALFRELGITEDGEQPDRAAELTLRQALKPTARRYRENLYRMRTPTMTPAPSNVRPRLRGF
jgi:hypothetical protein